MADVREQWYDAGQEPRPELQAILERLADLIGRLDEAIRQAERAARLHQGRLLQQLEEMSRGRQMRSAYGAVLATQAPSPH